MRSVIAGLTLVFMLPGCSILDPHENTNSYATKAVAGDHSEIVDPRERWEAYGLENYTIEQTRTCECLPPYTYTVVVKQGEVVDVLFDLPEGAQALPTMDYETVLAVAITVDSLFGLIERETPSATRIEVAYHPKFGYPSAVFIDRDERMADEEIILSLTNLKELVD